MTLKTVLLELARDQDNPLGSRACGYRFTAPLDDDGSIDAAGWRENRDNCRVVRFWEGEDDEAGHLIRKPGGSWAFHYDVNGDEDDDEAGYRFNSHVFKPGEYISILEHDDEMRTFKVIAVTPVR